MLQFLKKSGRKSIDANDESFHSNKDDSNNFLLNLTSLEDLPDNRRQSRISRSLQQIICDKECLFYFIQFLEVKKGLSYIKFYLDIENFISAAKLSIEVENNKKFNDKADINACCSTDINNSINNLQKCDNISLNNLNNCDRITFPSSNSENNLNIIEIESKIEQNQYLPHLKNLCDLSMRKPITDDEKSKIYAETNKQRLNIKNISDIQLFDKENAKNLLANNVLRIYRKYLTINSQFYIDLPATILSNISLAICSEEIDKFICKKKISNCYEDAQKYIFEKLEQEFLNDFLESPYYCKYCLNIITNTELQLYDIIYNEGLLFYFMEHLDQEHKSDYLEFWMAATNFQNHYEIMNFELNKRQACNDAMILYEKYFSLQALCPLKIADNIRSHVEEYICNEKDIIKCFQLPIKIIENYFEKNYLNNFLSSQLFLNYVNELKSKVNDIKVEERKLSFGLKMRHKKSNSDCSKENIRNSNIINHSLSQQNSLLAMSDNYRRKSTKDNDMQIDSRQLNDPDLLWKRNSIGGLSFGRINSLGRYERDFEMETIEDKWSLTNGGNKFKNVVRKLVNLPEDKVQEELAWQVAEMIVKDITSITLGCNSNEFN